MHDLTIVSHVVWALVSTYCLINYRIRFGQDLLRFVYITLTLNALNSLIGLAELYSDEALYSLRSLLDLLLLVLALPSLTTEIWLNYQVAQKEIAYLHTVLGLMPTYIYIFQHYTRQDLVDLAVVLNLVSLTGVGFRFRNYYSIMAAATFFISYSIFDSRLEIAFDLPSKYFFNFSMTIFTFCAYKAATQGTGA